VGIFDSGVGGLSVLRHIRTHLPHEHLLYFADSGYVPYGDKSGQMVADRVLAVVASSVGSCLRLAKLLAALMTGALLVAYSQRSAYRPIPAH
jgi:glutamate racemase